MRPVHIFRSLSLLHAPLTVLSSPNPHVRRDDVVTITQAPTLPSTAPQFVDDSLFTSAILNSTNFFRSEHNTSAVIWNKTIEDFATKYLNDDQDCTFAHSGGPYGENIALGCSDVTGCVELWGDERTLYNYNNPGFGEDTGHFTQLVWRNTTTVGCGRRLCDQDHGGAGWFLVCEYWPRGNIGGEYADNVWKQVNGTGTSAAVTSAMRPSLLVLALSALLPVAGVMGLW